MFSNTKRNSPNTQAQKKENNTLCIADGIWFLNSTPINRDLAVKFISATNYGLDSSFSFECVSVELNKIYVQFSRVVSKNCDKTGIVELTKKEDLLQKQKLELIQKQEYTKLPKIDEEINDLKAQISSLLNSDGKDAKVKELLIKTFDGSIPTTKGTVFLCQNQVACADVSSNDGEVVYGKFVATVRQ